MNYTSGMSRAQLSAAKRQYNNLANKINKRLDKIRSELGTDNMYYQELVSKINALGSELSVTDYMNQEHRLVSFRASNVPYVSRSGALWLEIIDKHGITEVEKYVNAVLDSPTYSELSQTIPKEYERLFGTPSQPMTLKEQAEAITNSNETITEAWQFLYSVASIQDVSDFFDEVTGTQVSDDKNRRAVQLANKYKNSTDMKNSQTIGGVPIQIGGNAVTDWRRERASAQRDIKRAISVMRSQGVSTTGAELDLMKVVHANIARVPIDELKKLRKRYRRG